jgi:hypothetical protein
MCLGVNNEKVNQTQNRNNFLIISFLLYSNHPNSRKKRKEGRKEERKEGRKEAKEILILDLGLRIFVTFPENNVGHILWSKHKYHLTKYNI